MKAADRNDSYSVFRETTRWRVALVLCVLIGILMGVLGVFNARIGQHATAMVAWTVLGATVACLGGLFYLPRQLAATVFFCMVSASLVVIVAVGAASGQPMQHWAYVFPPLFVFLLRSAPALVGMVAYGIYVVVMLWPIAPPIEVVRFANAYGTLVCFVFAYALLQERAAAMLRYHSDHDALTNCLNRRTFNAALDQLDSSTRTDTRCTILLIDIDHFKNVNDQHGHLVGDRIITEVAAVLGRVLDARTPLFRYGGEEFAAILYGAGVEAGGALAERLRAAVATADFRERKITVSIGASEWHATDGRVAIAVGEADNALYEAKRSGRNRVVVRNRPGPVGLTGNPPGLAASA